MNFGDSPANLRWACCLLQFDKTSFWLYNMSAVGLVLQFSLTTRQYYSQIAMSSARKRIKKWMPLFVQNVARRIPPVP